MTPIHPPSPSGRHRGVRLLAAIAALALTATLTGPSPAAAGVPEPAGAGNATASAAGGTYPVTLLTGDVAVLHIAPDGSQAAWLQEPADDRAAAAPADIYQLDDEVYVVPADAAPYLASGALDERLFNITQLARHGYDDTSREDLPLLLANAPDDGAAPAAAPAGARTVRQLDSIGAVSVSVDKSRARSVWESLRGPEQAGPSEADAKLAGAEVVWLNGAIHATLGDSTDVVGAPTAWDAGYDGTGVRVAVLDTGYDPDHPDLAGRVAGASDFTGSQSEPAAADRHGHGTHVAATVAGTGAASGGARRGVAPGADLLIGKVLDDNGSGFDDWIIEGMEWAAQQGARVVNMSLGSPWASDGTDPLSQAVNRLTEDHDVLFVISAGNSGPGERTVSSPGAADLALTVGATTKDDDPAWFSSRGPRFGDSAVKPEIVAPGVGIVAARAAGTSLGNLIDDHHTSLNGTSMAAPHVAGAAALLAQRHPDLDAAALKAQLVATSEHLEQPVHFQGAGRLDVAAAVDSEITVSHGSLSFGAVGDSETVSRTLTYRNNSERAVTLSLSAEVTATGVDGDRKPVLRPRPAALVIPAGGEADAKIELSAHASRPGEYAGHIAARGQRTGAHEVRTVMSATVDGPRRTVTVTAVNRDGEPATGPVRMWSADTGTLVNAHMADGTATLEVPDGRYAMMTSITTGVGFPVASYTIAAEPELAIRRDLPLQYDARDAEPVRVVTPRDTDTDGFRVLWHRQVGDRSFSGAVSQGIAGTDLYLLASKQARTGIFETTISWREVQPMLTAHVPGTHGFRIAPSPRLATPAVTWSGEEDVPVVYAGEGTPEEFSQVDVAGKVALVTRRDGFGHLASQADAARSAGAALLLAHNNEPGHWTESVWNGPLPVYIIDQDSGTAIRNGIDDDPGLTLELLGVSDATYNYELGMVESGAIPAGANYDVEDQALATVRSDYRQNSPRMGRNEMWIPYLGSSTFAAGSTLGRNGPVERTEYISTENVRWQQFGQPHGEFANMYWTWTGIEQYHPHEDYHRVWWGPLTRPGVPGTTGTEDLGVPVARFHDAIRISLVHYLYGQGHASGMIQNQLGDESELILRRDGEVVGSAPWPEAQFSVPPADADFELELRVDNGAGNFMDTSVATRSTWRFRSGQPADGHQVLPLVQLDYHLAADAHNQVPAGESYPLRIAPGYQPGAAGPEGFTLQVEVSYDDGQTWLDAPVSPADEMLEATVPAADAGAEFASVRVVATDAAGNSLTQQIDRSWRVGTD